MKKFSIYLVGIIMALFLVACNKNITNTVSINNNTAEDTVKSLMKLVIDESFDSSKFNSLKDLIDVDKFQENSMKTTAMIAKASMVQGAKANNQEVSEEQLAKFDEEVNKALTNFKSKSEDYKLKTVKLIFGNLGLQLSDKIGADKKYTIETTSTPLDSADRVKVNLILKDASNNELDNSNVVVEKSADNKWKVVGFEIPGLNQ